MDPQLPENCGQRLLAEGGKCGQEFGQQVVDYCNATQPAGFVDKVVSNMDEWRERLTADPTDLLGIAGACRKMSLGRGLR